MNGYLRFTMRTKLLSTPWELLLAHSHRDGSHIATVGQPQHRNTELWDDGLVDIPLLVLHRPNKDLVCPFADRYYYLLFGILYAPG